MNATKRTEYEYALMFQKFKNEFGYSQVDIADKFKKSPAFISKCLSLLDLPKEIQDKIVRNELSVKAAKEITNSYDDEKSQVKAARLAVKSALSSGRATATNREVLGSLKAKREAKLIADSLRTICAYMDGETMIDVDRLALLMERSENINQAMKDYKKGGKKNETN